MARTEIITRLEVATCPMHRNDLKHYTSHQVGCDCLSETRRDELGKKLTEAREAGNPLAEPAE